MCFAGIFIFQVGIELFSFQEHCDHPYQCWERYNWKYNGQCDGGTRRIIIPRPPFVGFMFFGDQTHQIFFIIQNLLIDFLLEFIRLFIHLPIIMPAIMANPIPITAIANVEHLFMLQHMLNLSLFSIFDKYRFYHSHQLPPWGLYTPRIQRSIYCQV